MSLQKNKGKRDLPTCVLRLFLRSPGLGADWHQEHTVGKPHNCLPFWDWGNNLVLMANRSLRVPLDRNVMFTSSDSSKFMPYQ